MSEEKKKKFKMPNSFTILFIITIVIAILTWIIPAGAYDVTEDGNFIAGTYHTVEQSAQGIWDVLAAPFIGMIGNDLTDGAIEVSLFILTIGGFLNVVTQTGAIDAGFSSIIRNNRDNMTKLIWVLMLIFCLGGSTYGMAEETIPFYTLLIPIMVAAGFDALVGVATVLVGSGMGVLASTVNPFATGIASSMAGIGLGEGILPRVIFFIVMYLIGGFFVTSYAKKVKKDDANSYLTQEKLASDREEFQVNENLEGMTGKQKVVITLFFLTFIIMILGLIPWSELNPNWTFFESIHESMMNAGWLGNLIGTSLLPFGQWYLTEITILFFLMSIVIAIVYGTGEEDYVNQFIAGANDMLSVALICAVARGIQVIMNDGQITATVLSWGENALSGLSSGFFIVLTYLFYIPMSFLIPSTSGLAAATMGIMAPLGQFAGVAEHLVITAFQAASGLLNLVTPTSGVVMGALAIAKVDLGTWWKFMAKLLAATAVASIILLVIFAKKFLRMKLSDLKTGEK